MLGAEDARHLPFSRVHDAGNTGRETEDGVQTTLCGMRDADAICQVPDDAMQGAGDTLQRTRCAVQCARNTVQKTRDAMP
jgi:hypothetical protein